MIQEHDTYWQEDISLFSDTFPSFESQRRSRVIHVRAKIHSSQERYSDIDTEIVPIAPSQGKRIYLNLHPYVAEPNILVTVGIPPHGYADTTAIGQVQDARIEGFRDIQIGNVQAWYYPADKILVLWECFLDSPFRERGTVVNDTQMRKLWQHVETCLSARFPNAERVVTPFSDPLFQIQEYRDGAYKEDVYKQACFCPYYVPLKGLALGLDWGVVVNPESPKFGQLVFEHDGCGCSNHPHQFGNQLGTSWIMRQRKKRVWKPTIVKKER